MRYLNDWIWLRLSNRYNVASATHSLGDVYNRWVNEVTGSLGVDLVDFYLDRIPDAESLNDAEYAYWSGGPLQDAVLWLDAGSTHPALVKVPNLGSGGSVLDAQYGNGSTVTTYPTLLEHTGENYVYFPTGPTSNNITFPNRASYNPTTQFSLTVRLGATDWSPTAAGDIVQRTEFADPNRQWSLSMLNTGALRLQVWPSGSAASFIIMDSGVLPLVDGRNYWIRVTFNGDNGSGSRVTTFEYADDQPSEPTSWIAGGTVTTAGTVSFTAVTSQVFVAVSTSRLDGRYYRFIYRVGGIIEIDADFTKLASGSQITFTESSSNAATGTISRATSGRKTVVVDRNVWLLGTDDYLEVADNDLLDFGATDSFTVMTVQRQWASFTAPQTYLAKTSGVVAPAVGWAIAQDATGPYFVIGDGTTAPFDYPGSALDSSMTTIVGVRNVAADTLTTYRNTTANAGATDTTTGTLANAEPMRIGRLSGAGTNYSNMELLAVAVWRRALTAAEIAQVVQYYNLSVGPWGGLVLGEDGVPILTETGDVINVE